MKIPEKIVWKCPKCGFCREQYPPLDFDLLPAYYIEKKNGLGPACLSCLIDWVKKNCDLVMMEPIN